jgi:pyruvate kinase
VVVATEMLHSMIERPTPTKAEISDISNAVLDGASAVMLSGETAVGPHGVGAVEVMDRILSSVEDYMERGKETVRGATKAQLAAATGRAIAELCSVLAITKVIAVTISGFAARMIASNGVPQPIIAVSNREAAARSFNLLPGTTGVFVDIPFSRTGTEHIPLCLEALWRAGLLEDTDTVLVTGLTYPHNGSRMNMISIHSIKDLSETLSWLGEADRRGESSVA